MTNGSSAGWEPLELRTMTNSSSTASSPPPVEPARRRIAVIPGDGIGREVVPIALDVVRAATRGKVEVDTVEFP